MAQQAAHRGAYVIRHQQRHSSENISEMALGIEMT